MAKKEDFSQIEYTEEMILKKSKPKRNWKKFLMAVVIIISAIVVVSLLFYSISFAQKSK